MSLEPFLRREWATSVRSSRAFRERRVALFLTGLVALGCFAAWDQLGWDRASVAGGYRFGAWSFGLMIGALAVLGLPLVIPQVASAIASEHQHRSIDALLASRLSSLEIVVGVMAAGLFRSGNALAASLPILILMMGVGGLSPGWLFLASLGLGSTILVMAAVSAAVSVVSKDGSQAVNVASGLFLAWVGLPTAFVILGPLVWPGAPGWLNRVALALVDASPAGIALNLSGIAPRPGGPVAAVLWLSSCELAGALVLAWWAVARLRPTGRARPAEPADQSSPIRACREPAHRPACGDDPVLWYEMHSQGGASLELRFFSQAISLVMLLGLGLGLWWFAEPAFRELAGRGYGPAREAFAMPAIDPIARFLANQSPTLVGKPVGALPGQARLEFNIVLRQVSALFLMGFITVAFGTARETLKGEQSRETWLALISTPLSGWEILRGKMGGTIWKIRDGAFTLLGLWGIGLISGAIHPFGFLLASALLAATGAFFIAQGQALALFGSHPDRVGKPVIPRVLLPIVAVASVALVACPMILVWTSLLTYEDFEATRMNAPFPQFSGSAFVTALNARAVLLTCLSGTTILTLGATLLIHTNARSFDESIGRPIAPRFRTRSLTAEATRARAVCEAAAHA